MDMVCLIECEWFYFYKKKSKTITSTLDARCDNIWKDHSSDFEILQKILKWKKDTKTKIKIKSKTIRIKIKIKIIFIFN